MSAVIPESKGGRDNPKKLQKQDGYKEYKSREMSKFIILGLNESSEIWTGEDKGIIIS